MKRLGSSNHLEPGPVFSFGIISDLHYADIPDSTSCHGFPRYHRHSLEALQSAMSIWNAKDNIQFAVQFGDIVEASSCSADESQAAMSVALGKFKEFRGQFFHILGDQCLSSTPRRQLIELLKIIGDSEYRSYYDFHPAPGFRMVFLDCYEISELGYPESHTYATTARNILQIVNPNSDKNSPRGMHLHDRRFIRLNGSITGMQLDWLDTTLRAATAAKEKVIICCHAPVNPDVCAPEALVWEGYLILRIIYRYNCVVAFISGHGHEGGYAVDRHGIHHRVLEAVVDCRPGHSAFGHVNVYTHKPSIVGTGRMISLDMPYFKHH
ncbi:hypothetical protein O6H91_17G000100 [Diphasiastrum complanatum]|uniref:Uncharacterized protein n=1 Tax=Diphasiastrum complanatum TaxID=34168 RepID=A0ACC2B3J7_DIPCM|nr:hypothetical protein O6H91_17G000100 [Diphasiastrum complanatum]